MKDWRYDRHQDMTKVNGILYTGDAPSKYSKPNTPIFNEYRSVVPRELAIVNQLDNEEEASKFMVKMVDFDERTRTVHPSVESPKELSTWLNPPERHEAYEFLWNRLTQFGALCNVAVWLYL